MRVAILSLLLLLSSCAPSAPEQQNVSFTAVVESVSEGSVLVHCEDEDLGFDKASVSYDASLKPDVPFVVGQELAITILPEIRESYPVQVTAVEIKPVSEEETVSYKRISGEEAAKMMTGEFAILDVRTQEEFDEGHIQGAILLPYDAITAETAAETLPNQEKTVLVYCRTGRRSEVAAKRLIDLGYTAVYDFGGITTDWRGAVVK